MQRLSRIGMILLVLFLATSASPAENSSLPLVMANDNRTPAGELKNGILNLRLELRPGRWYPEDEGGGYRDVYAFAEEGHAPQSSGPLIRAPQGTQIHATIHNTLPLPAKIYGLHRHPGDAKGALRLGPGETRELQFLAGEPGTYLYWATTSDKTLVELREDGETMLSGAFVVDAPGTKPDDRIFVLGIWVKDLAHLSGEISSINGKSWPYTEHLTYKLGETTHWRVINPTQSDHAMHLHGFFFTVDGAGDGERYETYREDQRPQAVTEHVESGHVFEMTWTAGRAGNWLFHCHMLTHMLPTSAFAPKEVSAADSSAHDRSMGMAGLVIGITVPPVATPALSPAETRSARKLQLVISDNPGKIPLYDLEVNDPMTPAAPDKKKAASLLGPPIVLTRGEATEIEVQNHSSDPTVIHWHGLELENYYDGVTGWTGSGQQTTPAIAPGTSFIARMTPKRAGTFIYHTHWHNSAQLLNGLYGPLIVLEPGQKYDPEHDRTFVFSTGRYGPFPLLLLVNGDPQPDTVELHIGTSYRLRFINITVAQAELRVRLTNKGVPARWKVIAKDGADLPSAQLRVSTADIGVSVGETYDVEYRPETEGLADLEIRAKPDWPVIQPLKLVGAK